MGDQILDYSDPNPYIAKINLFQLLISPVECMCCVLHSPWIVQTMVPLL